MFGLNLKNHFIPHDGNDYTPQFLQKAAFLGMLGLILISFLAANMQALLWQSSRWLTGAVLPAVIVDLTNTQRKDLSLPTLTRNAVLDAAAQMKANDMAAGHYFAHNSPTGVTPWHWFEKAGYVYTYAGENLAVYFTDSNAVVDAWMKSPTHRANIVGPNYREIGVGTAKGTYNGYDTIFVVQLFGSPAVKPVPVLNKAVTQAPLAVPTTTLRPVVPAVAVKVPLATKIPVTNKTPATTTKTKNLNTKVVAVADTEEPLVAGESTSSLTAEATIAPANIEAPVETNSAKAVVAQNPPDVPVGDFNDMAVYSDLAATSTNLAPAYVTVEEKLKISDLSPLDIVATEPNTVLKYLYMIIGFFVSLALLSSVVIEWRQHRPVQTAYGVGLLVIMVLLFFIHTMVTSGATVL